MRLNGLLGSSRMVSDSELKVVVLGLGYIGLPTAAVIARTGAPVLGIDVSEHVVETVNSGKVHIEAADLDGLVPDRKSVVSGKRVSVSVDLGGRRIIKKKK